MEDLTREELAALAEAAGAGDRPVAWAAELAGVSRRTISRWLSGGTTPSRSDLARLRVRASIAARVRALRAERAGLLAGAGRWWKGKLLLRRIRWAAYDRLITQAISNLEMDRAGPPERDRLPGGRADRAPYLFPRETSGFLAPGGAGRFLRRGP